MPLLYSIVGKVVPVFLKKVIDDVFNRKPQLKTGITSGRLVALGKKIFRTRDAFTRCLAHVWLVHVYSFLQFPSQGALASLIEPFPSLKATIGSSAAAASLS